MLSEGILTAIGAGIGAIITALGILIVNIIKAKKEKTGDKELEYSHTENLIKLISSQGQDMGEIKNSLSSIRTDLNQLSQYEEEFNRKYLRHSILRVYYSYNKEKTIPEPEWESVLGLYDTYIMLNGNGFVHDKVEEMKSWKKE